MKKTLLTLVAFVAASLSSSAEGIDTYSRSDFRLRSSDQAHELRLNHPVEFGAEDWTITLKVRIGKGFYVDKDEKSWGSTLLASGANPFPEYFDDKPFQLFLRIANTKDADHIWGGIPTLDALGAPTIEGITHVLGSEEIRDTAQRPRAGEVWEFTLSYRADKHRLSSSAGNVADAPTRKPQPHEKDVSHVNARIDYLSTSVLGLKEWKLLSLSVARGEVSPAQLRADALCVWVREHRLPVFGGLAIVVALLLFGASCRRKKR